jgi:hypothetical protein
MKYKVYTLTVKWEKQTAKKYDFYEMKEALEAAWALRDSPIVEYIKLKTEWRETPEWLKEIAKAGSALK